MKTMTSNMSLPLYLVPDMDKTAPLEPGRTMSAPEIARIHKWQAGIEPGNLAEKPLPSEKPLPPLPTPPAKKTGSWKKLVAALSPLARKSKSPKPRGPGAFTRLEDDCDVEVKPSEARSSEAMYITGEYFFRGSEMMAWDDKVEKDDDDFTALPEMTEELLEESSRQRQEFGRRRSMWMIRGVGKGAREMRGWRE